MENKFMRVEEVAEVLEVSTSFAYKVIRQLNDALVRVSTRATLKFSFAIFSLPFHRRNFGEPLLHNFFKVCNPL